MALGTNDIQTELRNSEILLRQLIDYFGRVAQAAIQGEGDAAEAVRQHAEKQQEIVMFLKQRAKLEKQIQAEVALASTKTTSEIRLESSIAGQTGALVKTRQAISAAQAKGKDTSSLERDESLYLGNIAQLEDQLRRAQAARQTTLSELNQLEIVNTNVIAAGNEVKKQATKRISDITKETKHQTEQTKKSTKAAMDFEKRLTIAAQKIITYRIAFGAYRAVTNALSDAVYKSREFNSTIQDLKKVIDPAQGSLQRLVDASYTLGSIYGKSANEVASTFSIFAQQGLQVNAILERTNAVLKLSATSAITAADAVEALTAVTEAYPEFMNNATEAVDKWAAVQANAPSTTQDLAQAMMRVGIAAKEVGVTFDQFGGIVSAINEVTRRSGREIGNSLKTMFANIVAEDAIMKLQRYGIVVMETQNTFRPMGSILDDIQSKWKDFSNSERVAIAQIVGDKRRYTDFLALMQNYDRYVTSTVDSLTAQGEAQKMLIPETEKFNRQIEALNTIISKFKISLMDGLLPTFISFFKVVAKGTEFLRKHTGLFKFLATTVGLSTIAFLTFSKISKIVTAHLVLQTAATNALATAQTGLVAKATLATLVMGKLSLILAGIGAIVAVLSFVGIIKGFKKLGDSTDDVTLSINKATDALKKFEDEQLSTIKTTTEIAEEMAKQMVLMDIKSEYDAAKKRLDIFQNYAQDKLKIQQQLSAKSAEISAERDVLKSMGLTDKELEGPTPYYNYNVLRAERKSLQDQLDTLENMGVQIDQKWFSVSDPEEAKAGLKALATEVDATVQKLREFITPKTPTFKIIPITEYREEVERVKDELDNVITTLANAENKSVLFGESFYKVEEYRKILQGIHDQLVQNMVANKEEIRLLEAQEGIYKDWSGFTEEMKVEKKTRLDLLKTELASNQQIYDITSAQLNQVMVVQNSLLRQQEAKRNDILHTLDKTNSMYEIMIQLNQLEGKGVQKLSSMRAIDFVNLRKIMKEEMTVLDLKKAQKLEAIELESAAKNVGLTQKDHLSQLHKIAQINKVLVEDEQERLEVALQLVVNTAKYIKNMQSAVAAAFSEAFVKIPEELTDASEKIKEINKERLETENELKNARIKNDADATREASKKLNDLKNQLKEVHEDQIKAFTDVFGAVGNVAIQKWGEQFADSMFSGKAAEFLASGIIPAGLRTAQIWYNSIVKAFTDAQQTKGAASADMSVSTDEKTGESTLAISAVDEAGNILSTETQKLSSVANQIGNKWEQALQVGGNLAAVALMRAFGIGVGEISNSLSTFGSMLGAAAGTQWFKGAGSLLNLGSFAGPFGTIVGGLLGAAIGSAFETDPTPYIDKNTEALKSNTTAVENNNNLLSMQREFINAPVGYAPNTMYAYGSGSSGLVVNVSINGSASPSSVGQEVVRQIDAAYANSTKRMQTQYSRFGR